MADRRNDAWKRGHARVDYSSSSSAPPSSSWAVVSGTMSASMNGRPAESTLPQHHRPRPITGTYSAHSTLNHTTASPTRSQQTTLATDDAASTSSGPVIPLNASRINALSRGSLAAAIIMPVLVFVFLGALALFLLRRHRKRRNDRRAGGGEVGGGAAHKYTSTPSASSRSSTTGAAAAAAAAITTRLSGLRASLRKSKLPQQTPAMAQSNTTMRHPTNTIVPYDPAPAPADALRQQQQPQTNPSYFTGLDTWSHHSLSPSSSLRGRDTVYAPGFVHDFDEPVLGAAHARDAAGDPVQPRMSLGGTTYVDDPPPPYRYTAPPPPKGLAAAGGVGGAPIAAGVVAGDEGHEGGDWMGRMRSPFDDPENVVADGFTPMLGRDGVGGGEEGGSARGSGSNGRRSEMPRWSVLSALVSSDGDAGSVRQSREAIASRGSRGSRVSNPFADVEASPISPMASTLGLGGGEGLLRRGSDVSRDGGR